MNCKAGDLAIITRIPQSWLIGAEPEKIKIVMSLVGKIVRCVKLIGSNDLGYPVWDIEEPITINDCTSLTSIEDVVLTPIKGGNIDNEIPNELEAV